MIRLGVLIRGKHGVRWAKDLLGRGGALFHPRSTDLVGARQARDVHVPTNCSDPLSHFERFQNEFADYIKLQK